MNKFIIIATLLLSSIGIAQDNIEIENDSISTKQTLKEELKKEEERQQSEDKVLRAMAEQRATELQKELNLDNYISYKVLEAIVKYSKKANKVLQSNLPERQKTKDLSTIVYFQNREFKKLLTVHQYYKYLKISGLN